MSRPETAPTASTHQHIGQGHEYPSAAIGVMPLPGEAEQPDNFTAAVLSDPWRRRSLAERRCGGRRLGSRSVEEPVEEPDVIE